MASGTLTSVIHIEAPLPSMSLIMVYVPLVNHDGILEVLEKPTPRYPYN